MGENIPGGDFLGISGWESSWGDFPGGVWWVEMFRVGIFLELTLSMGLITKVTIIISYTDKFRNMEAFNKLCLNRSNRPELLSENAALKYFKKVLEVVTVWWVVNL